MSRTGPRSNEPRAVIHRRILDVADDMPDASLEKIADDVSGASAELVDKVLAEYGDPSAEPSEPDDGTDTDADSTESADTRDVDADPPTGTGDEDGARLDATELSERQLETLDLIARNPDATQRELAAELDVTAATVSRWVNGIPGFDWSDREAFAERVLDDGSDGMAGPDGEPGATTGSNDDPDGTARSNGDSPGSDASVPDNTPALIAGDTDVATEDMMVEMNGNAENGRTEKNTGGRGNGTAEFDDTGSDRIDTELLHKVIDACMDSERITQKEEIRLLDHLLDRRD